MPRGLTKLLIVVPVLAGAGFLIYLGVRPKPLAVATWELKKLEMSETVSGVSTGFVEPARQIAVQPEVSARIKEIKVRRGDRVRAGDTLVVLDDSELRNQVTAADAAVALFEARLKQARAHHAQLTLDCGRVKKLWEAGSISGQQYENAKMALDLAATETEAAESALRQAGVSREMASASLRKTLVRAPFGGILLDSSLEVGQIWGGVAISSLNAGSIAGMPGRPEAMGMTSGAAALITGGQAAGASIGRLEIGDDSEMFVSVDIDENDYGKVKTGQTADLIIGALGQRKVAGEVVEIYPFISRALDQNRTARVKIRLSRDLRADILPGMSVGAEILVSSRKEVLAAPTAAILIRPSGKIVYRVVDGVLEETRVETGISNWEWSEITSGLAAGDHIARPPENANLKDRMRVVEKDRER